MFDAFIVLRGFSNGPVVERTRHFLGQLQNLLISSGGLCVSSMSPQDFFFLFSRSFWDNPFMETFEKSRKQVLADVLFCCFVLVYSRF